MRKDFDELNCRGHVCINNVSMICGYINGVDITKGVVKCDLLLVVGDHQNHVINNVFSHRVILVTHGNGSNVSIKLFITL